ncbi:MAG: phospholipase D-like domain-containing protein [Ferruginibacter sp.]
MFRSLVLNTADWNYEPVLLTVPNDKKLRYPGYQLRGIRVTRIGGEATQVSIPVISYVKMTPAPGALWVELEPLLISNVELAKRFTMGFPSLYIVLPESAAQLTNRVMEPGESLGSFTEFSFAIQFSDRIERDISLAADTILTALQDTEAGWGSFCTALHPQADIVFLNANGKSFDTPIRLRFQPSTGTIREFEYTPFVSSLRQLTNNQTGTLRLADFNNVGNTNFVWVNVQVPGEIISSEVETVITANTRIIMLANLHEWFAQQTIEEQLPDTNPLFPQHPRFTRKNNVTPYVNGPDYFHDAFTELNKAATEDGRFFLAGYSMQQDDELFISDDENMAKTVLDAAKKIVAANGKCYFLPLQFFDFNRERDVTAEEVIQVAVAIAVLMDNVVFGVLPDSTSNKAALLVIEGLILIGAGLTAYLAKDIVDSDFALGKTARGASKVDKLNFDKEGAGDGKSRMIWSVHPGTFEDNSYTGPSSSLVEFAKSVLRGVTAYHQKIAVVKTNEWIAYCGGIDMSGNRMDDDQHMNAGPYHDVQAKVTGPAVRDIANTFIERWKDEIAKGNGNSVNAEDLELLQNDLLILTNGNDYVQIARTIFKPAGGSDRAFTYAPEGDRTVIDTILLSMRNAKEYIYIEDQYFTPTPEYVDALIYAIDHGLKSLVIMICSKAGQVFSEPFRTAIVNRLLAKNNETDPLNPVVRIGYPRRGYTLPSTSSEVLTGRMKLGRDLSASATEIVLGPVIRIPSAPFWVAINGEIILVTAMIPGSVEIEEVEGEEAESDDTYRRYQHYSIERGSDTRFFNDITGYPQKAHKKGTAATAVMYNDIYVHAKCMMIDDMFVSIGSANLNRRGFHSDTETNVFVVPELLRFDPDNPVSSLRKKLWAEWLNIPSCMGKTLLEDPVAASKLFDRDTATGNRFVPYTAVSKAVASYLGNMGNVSLSADMFPIDLLTEFKNLIVRIAQAEIPFQYDELFFHVTDPSSFTEDPPEPL